MNSEVVIKIVILFAATVMLGSGVFFAYNISEYLIAGIFFVLLLMMYIMVLVKLDLQPVKTCQMVMDANELKTYYRQHKMIPLLKNSIVECRLIMKDDNSLQIYCKECPKEGIRWRGIKTHDFLEANTVALIWGTLQMYFNNHTDSLNISCSFYDYFEKDNNYYLTNLKNEAQNEYCRMILYPELSIIKCFEIWKNNSKCFYIKGEISILNNVLETLQQDNYAFYSYRDLYKMYKTTKDLQVLDDRQYIFKVDINNAELEEINSLPGINIALAKKIIKKREEINGFKSIEDVLLYAKVKPNVYKSLVNKIYVTPMKQSLAKVFNIERTIDL